MTPTNHYTDLGFALTTNQDWGNLRRRKAHPPILDSFRESIPLPKCDHVSPSAPVLTETPWDSIRRIVKERVIIGGRTFLIHRPYQSKHLLGDSSVQASFAADEYLPYWTDLWPAARMLAKMIMKEAWAPGTPVLEVGCGLGLPGIVALSRGMQVTFADCDATALRFAADNARANHFHDFRLLHLDWRHPPPRMSFPVILASDLAYELRNLAPLAAFIKRVLEPDGVCLLTDPDRPLAPRLREELMYEGLTFTTQLVRAGQSGGQRLTGTLYRIRHAAGNRLCPNPSPAYHDSEHKGRVSV